MSAAVYFIFSTETRGSSSRSSRNGSDFSFCFSHPFDTCEQRLVSVTYLCRQDVSPRTSVDNNKNPSGGLAKIEIMKFRIEENAGDRMGKLSIGKNNRKICRLGNISVVSPTLGNCHKPPGYLQAPPRRVGGIDPSAHGMIFPLQHMKAAARSDLCALLHTDSPKYVLELLLPLHLRTRSEGTRSE